MINTEFIKSKKVETKGLEFLIEGRRTQKGTPYYMLTTSCGSFRLASMESVLDFINNNSFGHVE